MDRKNLLVFVLGGTAVVFLFLFMMVLGEAKQKDEQVKKLDEEKTNLTAKVEGLEGQQRGLNEKINYLNGQVDGLNGDKMRLQEQIDSTARERDELRGEISRLNNDLAQARSAVEIAKNQAAQQPVQDRSVQYNSSDNSNNEYWAAVLKQKAGLEAKLESLNQQVSELKFNAEKLQREKGELEQEMNALNRENADVKRELDYNKKMVDNLTLDLAMETSNGLELKKNVDGLRLENKNLRSRLRSLGERKENLEVNIADLKAKNVALEASIEKMQVFMKEKLDQVNALKDDFASIKTKGGEAAPEPQRQQAQRKEAVNLPPIVIRPDGGATVTSRQSREIEEQVDVVQKAAATSVVAINKDNNFVIINQGSSQGVKVGDSFRIFDSKNQPAGDVEVIQVRENIAACDIKREIQPLKVGFAVR